MRILLIMPKLVEKAGNYYDMPLGILYISAALKQAGIQVECLNLNHTDQSVAAVIKHAIISQDIDIVCTGGLCLQYHIVKYIFESAKKAKKDLITIGGGGLISSEPELMLRALPMDVGVVGEGEITLVELVQTLELEGDLSRVKGIVFKDPLGKPMVTKPRSPIEDLDLIPYPDYAGFDFETYLDRQSPGDFIYMSAIKNPRLMPIVSSRSCPFSCTFCYHPLGKKYRQRSLDSLFNELDGYIKMYHVNMLYIMDELFAVDEQRLLEFSERIEPYGVKWIPSLRADLDISFESLRKLKKAGAFYLGYGLESASNTVLRSMQKRITIEMVNEKYEMTRRAGLATGGNIILGDPAETMETVNESLSWWQKSHRNYNINGPGLVMPYPGSKLYHDCLEKKIIPDKLEFFERNFRPVNMTGMTEAQLESVQNAIAKAKTSSRFLGEIISIKDAEFDPEKKVYLYTAEIICPRCGYHNTYERIHVKEIRISEVLCQECFQKYEFLPSRFPHIRKKVTQFKDKLTQIADNGRPVSVSPCLYKYDFLEFLNIFEINLNDLNLKYFLDVRPRQGLVGKDWEQKYPLLERTPAVVKQTCEDHVFLITPWPNS